MRPFDLSTTSALALMACSGLLISWAIPAAKVPIEASRSARNSACSVRRRSSISALSRA